MEDDHQPLPPLPERVLQHPTAIFWWRNRPKKCEHGKRARPGACPACTNRGRRLHAAAKAVYRDLERSDSR